MVYLVLSGPTKVKIGYANDAYARIKSLQTANPTELKILLIVDGSRKTETAWHHYFEKYRIKGTEWFRVKGELRECIRAIKTKTTNIKIVDLKTFIQAGKQYTILQKAKRNKKLANYLKTKRLVDKKLKPKG